MSAEQKSSWWLQFWWQQWQSLVFPAVYITLCPPTTTHLVCIHCFATLIYLAKGFSFLYSSVQCCSAKPFISSAKALNYLFHGSAWTLHSTVVVSIIPLFCSVSLLSHTSLHSNQYCPRMQAAVLMGLPWW